MGAQLASAFDVAATSWSRSAVVLVDEWGKDISLLMNVDLVLKIIVDDIEYHGEIGALCFDSGEIVAKGGGKL